MTLPRLHEFIVKVDPLVPHGTIHASHETRSWLKALRVAAAVDETKQRGFIVDIDQSIPYGETSMSPETWDAFKNRKLEICDYGLDGAGPSPSHNIET